MAARRLIIVLILLLAASVVAASIAPDRTSQLVGVEPNDTEETTATTATDATTTEDTTGEATTTAPEAAPQETGAPEGAAGLGQSRRIEASVEKPETVRAVVGDQLALLIGSNPPRTVTILPLGVTAFAGDDAPARFDLLLREAGTYAVTDIDDPNVVLGRLQIREPLNP